MNVYENTYEGVAGRKGLPSGVKARFVLYMKRRWADKEKIQSQTGYAGEWADRFLSGDEYRYSDSIGQAVLRDIDGQAKAD